MFKKIFVISFFFIVSCTSTFAQTFEWRLVPGIPFSGRYEDLYFIDSQTGWVIDYNKVYKTTNSGTSWQFFSHPGSNRSIGFFDSQTGINGTLDTGKVLWRTTNGGVNWTLIPLPTPSSKGVCGISIVNQNTAYICGSYYSDGKAYKTTDKGETWALVLNDTSIIKSAVDCYFGSPDSGIVVGGYNATSFISGNSVVVMTTNGGNSWQRVFKSTRIKEWCWKISFVSKNVGFVSVERIASDGLSYILKTTNGGFNWTEIPFMPYNQEGIGFLNENTGWVGGYGGSTMNSDSTYETTNGGTNWHTVGWGQWLNRIRFINDTLAFGCGHELWKYSREMVSVQGAQTEIPSQYNLHQNYPNPFNPITLIEYDIAKTGFVKITVYDALGKEVRTLINNNLPAGSYQASFDAGYFPSGIYFYKLETENFSQTRRMILLK